MSYCPSVSSMIETVRGFSFLSDTTTTVNLTRSFRSSSAAYYRITRQSSRQNTAPNTCTVLLSYRRFRISTANDSRTISFEAAIHSILSQHRESKKNFCHGEIRHGDSIDHSRNITLSRLPAEAPGDGYSYTGTSFRLISRFSRNLERVDSL